MGKYEYQKIREMDRKTLVKLIERLKGSDWLFFSGFAVEIYTKGQRKAKGDVDVLIARKDIDTVAQRLGCNAGHRKFKKAPFTVDDYGFVTNFLEWSIEASSGFPKERLENGSIKKVFNNKVIQSYLGVKVPIEPIEEVIVHKAFMHRLKDVRDLELLRSNKFNSAFVKELAKDWGAYKKIISFLKRTGYVL